MGFAHTCRMARGWPRTDEDNFADLTPPLTATLAKSYASSAYVL